VGQAKTDVSWGNDLSNWGTHLQLARHPSQLYQFAHIRRCRVFIAFMVLFSKIETRYCVSVCSYFGYGIFRILVNLCAKPDSIKLCYLAFGWLTQGQTVVFAYGYVSGRRFDYRRL